jgi:hypothetical protein
MLHSIHLKERNKGGVSVLDAGVDRLLGKLEGEESRLCSFNRVYNSPFHVLSSWSDMLTLFRSGNVAGIEILNLENASVVLVVFSGL